MQTELKVSYGTEPPRAQPPTPPPTVKPAEVARDVASGPAVVSAKEARPQQDVQQTRDDAERAVKQMNDYVQTVNRNLEFSVDEELGKTIIKVVDRETKEVIRQIPSEEMLAIARHLADSGNTGGPVLLEAKT